MARFLALWWLVWIGVFPAWAGTVPVPALQSPVTDLTATLSAPTRAAIEAKLADLERRKGSQLAVLLVPTTGDETVEQYALHVAEAWKLGRKDVDDGVLLLVAKTDRSLRIEVGYGLEGAIPDAVGKRVIDEIIVPRFKSGDYEGGVVAGVDSLIRLIDGEPLPEPVARSGGNAPDAFDWVFPALIFTVAVGGVVRAIFGPLLGASLMGGVVFLGIWLLAGALLVGVIMGIVAFFLTLFGVASHGGSSGGGWSSGGGGGWGSGGGGFSGGGGGFGGGGASGRW